MLTISTTDLILLGINNEAEIKKFIVVNKISIFLPLKKNIKNIKFFKFSL